MFSHSSCLAQNVNPLPTCHIFIPTYSRLISIKDLKQLCININDKLLKSWPLTPLHGENLLTLNQTQPCLANFHLDQSHQTVGLMDGSHYLWQRHHSFHGSEGGLTSCHQLLPWHDSSSCHEHAVGCFLACDCGQAQDNQVDHHDPVASKTPNKLTTTDICSLALQCHNYCYVTILTHPCMSNLL